MKKFGIAAILVSFALGCLATICIMHFLNHPSPPPSENNLAQYLVAQYTKQATPWDALELGAYRVGSVVDDNHTVLFAQVPGQEKTPILVSDIPVYPQEDGRIYKYAPYERDW
jgi:hypothetical protein